MANGEDPLAGLGKQDRKLLEAFGVSQFTLPGSDSALFGGAAPGLERRLRKRGLDPSLAPDISDLGELNNFIGSFTKVKNRDKSQTLQKIAAASQIQQAAEEEERRSKAIDLAAEAIDRFSKDRSFDTLLEKIRELPPTLSDSDVDFLRQKASTAARKDEAARLRRVGASVGLRGTSGGGAIASLAEQAASNADRQVSDAFTRIRLEQIESRRTDELEAIQQEAALLGERQSRELQLQQNFQFAQAGIPVVSAAGGFQDFSAFLEAQNALHEAERRRSQARRDAFYQMLFETGGELAGAGIGGAFGGPMGAQLGGQIGQQAGGLAGAANTAGVFG